MNKSIKKLTFSALFLALCLVLPFLTGQIPQIGQMLSPMHIPVLLCGFVCGWGWGLAVGFIAPLLRSILFGMPALFPNAVAMAFELAAYGFLAGILYKAFPKKPVYVYVTLILAMIGGRIVWGIADYILLGINGTQLTMEMFISSVVLKSIPGIILHIVLVPIIVLVLKKANLILNE